MFNEFLNAVLLGIGLAFMVGPVFFTLIETSITKGTKAAIIFDLGVVLADVAFILVAYFGSVVVLKKIENITTTPNTIITSPAILLIHHNCFNLNFFLTKFIKKVKANHQIIAPIKTPKIINDDLKELFNELNLFIFNILLRPFKIIFYLYIKF